MIKAIHEKAHSRRQVAQVGQVLWPKLLREVSSTVRSVRQKEYNKSQFL